MLIFSAYINSFMAIFNLIPFGVLDGYKIFSLNKKVWVVAFIPAAVLNSDNWVDTFLLNKDYSPF